jgi:hypothetical protein
VRIAWAFDPFDANRKLQQRALAILRASNAPVLVVEPG